MDFEVLFSVLLIASYHFQCGDGRMTLTIKDFLSDSNADHSQAFQNAWKALCGAKEAKSLVIHANETYTIIPQLFRGPCVSRNLHIQIDGTIEAPKTIRGWGISKIEYWLSFESVTGLFLNGSGLLDSHGQNWWSSVGLFSRPVAVRFHGCKDIIYNGLTQRDSPKNHISISSCTNATLSNLHIIAPANSPNTDGIDISLSNNIRVLRSSIKTGDDCIAINGGSFDINITRVACGPGHGISIGSLGKGGANDVVQNVKVRRCRFDGTENGARIKTWPGGRGFAKNILYENITLINAKFPIIIDQQYDGRENGPPGATAMKISDVTFRYFEGTCADATAVKIACDKKVGCDNIVMEHINIVSSTPKTSLVAYCQFANVVSRFVSVVIKCASREYSQHPSSCHEPALPYSQPPSSCHEPASQPPSLYPQPPSPSHEPSSPYPQSPLSYPQPPLPYLELASPYPQPPTPYVKPQALHAQLPLLFPF